MADPTPANTPQPPYSVAARPATSAAPPCSDPFTSQETKSYRDTPPLSADQTGVRDEPYPDVPGYTIVGILGRGGMGVVYKARQESLKRLVALKMIRGGEHLGREALARFQSEAETVARLQHPNIVQIFEIGTWRMGADGGAIPFFALEYVDVGSLSKALAGTPQPPRDAAALTATLARAIHAAHQRGIIHRDLKPANILLSGERQGARGENQFTDDSSAPLVPHLSSLIPKITDFGLAKHLDDPSGPTQAGAILGTPSYMAPEQAAGDVASVSPATDVYALGAILYETLTGRPPFKGTSTLETLEQVRNQEPVPPSQLQPKTPGDVETICLKCLQKEPAKRFTTAQDLAEDLERYLKGEPIRARRSGRIERLWKWVKRRPAAAASLVLGSLLLLGIVGGTTAAVVWDNLRTQQYLKDLKAENDKTELARQDAVIAQKEAEFKGEEAIKQGKLAEHRRQLEEIARKREVERAIRLTVATGQKHLAEGDLGAALLYYAEAAALDDPKDPQYGHHLLRLATGLQQCPRPIQLWRHQQGVTHVEFSPDGQRVLTAGQDGKARVWHAATGQAITPILTHDSPINHAAFSVDGKRVITGSEDKTARVWDATTGQLLSIPLPHRDPVIQVGFHPKSGAAFTVSGTRFATTKQGQDRRIMTGIGPGGVPQYTTLPGSPVNPRGAVQIWEDLQDKKASKVITQIGWINSAEFSVDGKHIVTSAAVMPGGGSGNNLAQIWNVVEPKKYFKAVRHDWHVMHASFSPHGNQVVVATGTAEESFGEAFIWDPSKGETIGAPMKHRGQVIHAWFSLDGQRILTASADKTARVWDAANGDPVTPPLQHKERLTGAWFSPDGRQVLTASADGTARLWNAFSGEPTGPWLKHGAPVTCAAWSAKGPFILTGSLDGTVRLWDLATPLYGAAAFKHGQGKRAKGPALLQSVIQFGDGSSRAFKAMGGTIVTNVLFSPDGKRLLASSGHRTVEMASGGSQAQASTGIETTDLTVWNIEDAQAGFPTFRQNLPIAPRLISPQGHVLTLGETADKAPAAVQVVELSGGRLLSQQPLDKDEQVKWLGFTESGTALVVGNPGKGQPGFRVKDARTGKTILAQDADAGLVSVAAISRDGKRLALLIYPALPGKKYALATTLEVWDLTDSKLVGGPWKRPRLGNQLIFSGDGKHVVTFLSGTAPGLGSTAEGEAHLWRVSSGQSIVLKHKGPVLQAVFSSDQKYVATTSADRCARVWSVETGQPVSPPLEHKGKVYNADFRGNELLVTAGADGLACLWDIRTGELVAPPLKHREGVLAASFSPNGQRLVTACEDGTARIWELATGSRSLHDWKFLIQVVAGHRLDQTLGLTPLPASEIQTAWEMAKQTQSDEFNPSAARALGWRKDELEQAHQASHWHADLVHLDAMIEAEPKQGQWWLRRGQALAQLGRWADAELAFSQALATGESGLEVRHPLTLLQIWLEKKDQYRVGCEHLLRSHGGDDDSAAAQPVLRACILAPDSLERFDALLSLTEKRALAKGAVSADKLNFAAACYRAGRFDEAGKTFSDKSRTYGAEGLFSQGFLALIHHRLGQIDQAQDAWTKLKDGLAVEVATLPRTMVIPSLAAKGQAKARPVRLTWSQRLELAILAREVQMALGKP